MNKFLVGTGCLLLLACGLIWFKYFKPTINVKTVYKVDTKASDALLERTKKEARLLLNSAEREALKIREKALAEAKKIIDGAMWKRDELLADADYLIDEKLAKLKHECEVKPPKIIHIKDDMLASTCLVKAQKAQLKGLVNRFVDEYCGKQ